ncbi:hypothetical protein FIV42_19940 [Persicimonas caeni]|uniref:Uncharacterized protein n=1 Tax=Persicimonas caeni TaxID=2292766 RepID=A0A4Y6PXH6_PERCE|nr:hypothetical protein [Persicimonas caeni]QDG52930.1 hypothetical protein FIV42_19940 [Persicimonas caeni]QED34152.1 hypothetical protein FRD00_19935 [Persicimonas caeni]
MSTPNLDQLTPTLQALDAADVSAPHGMPIDVFLAEAEALVALATRAEIAAKLTHVGVADARLARFEVALGAAREAQAAWTQVRSRRQTEEFEAAVADGESLRRDMLHACSWNLRRNRKVREALKFVREGDGHADLAQDLHDLASLIDNNRAAFDSDGSFDAVAVAERARGVAATLMGESASYRLRFTSAGAKEMRDRAFTFLDDLVQEVREAGRYVFRDDEEMARRFASSYWRRFEDNDVLDTEPTEPTEPEQPAEPVDVDTDREPVPAEE